MCVGLYPGPGVHGTRHVRPPGHGYGCCPGSRYHCTCRPRLPLGGPRKVDSWTGRHHTCRLCYSKCLIWKQWLSKFQSNTNLGQNFEGRHVLNGDTDLPKAKAQRVERELTPDLNGFKLQLNWYTVQWFCDLCIHISLVVSIH